MANQIQLFKKYVTLLDEVYKEAAKTSVLDSDMYLVRDGANTNEIVIPKLTMQGLGKYSRNDGYTKGDVSLTYETAKFNYERGRKFTIDAMDNEETAGIAFGRLAGEFIRTQVAPEGDAFRFATYAGIEGVGTKEETLDTGEKVIKALRDATNAMDEAEVPHDERYLFITPTLLGLVMDMETIKSKEVLNRFTEIIQVPQTRFYTAIDMLDGESEGEKAGGYKKAEAVYKASTDTTVQSGKTYYTKAGNVYTPVSEPTGNPSTSNYYELVSAAGADLNFEVIHKPAVMQYNKHIAPKIITPEANQDADAWIFGYRKYGLADAYENKLAGIYASHKPVA